jgi:hypothetical protein
LLAAVVCVCFPAFALAAPRDYADNLSLAVAGMEQGKHPSSLVPIRNAMGVDRNEPLGMVALGILYLHADSPAAAAEEFRRARKLAPDEPLAEWGVALAALAQGKGDVALFRTLNSRDAGQEIPAGILADASLLSLYTRLIGGDIRGVRHETESVTADESSLLRLEIAAFAALRGGDKPRGEALLASLLKRPTMRVLAEDAALALTFESDKPAEGQAPGLPDKLQFPPPPKSTATLSGRVTLSPPADLPGSASYVSYSVDGGAYSATTNNHPFRLDWNTARLPNGLYTLRTIVFDNNQRLLRQTTRTITLSNRDAPSSPNYLTGDQRSQLRTRLWALLTPRPCRKAAHFALAERAVETGDSDAALSRMESVCAIDPAFRGAYLSLRRFFVRFWGRARGSGRRERPRNWLRSPSMMARTRCRTGPRLCSMPSKKRMPPPPFLLWATVRNNVRICCSAWFAKAPGLPDKLQFPPPPKSTATLSGRVTLSPPADLPGSASYVSYSVDGGAYSATTNNHPFRLDWNTARLPNGLYTLRTIVFDNNQRLLRQTTRTITLSNRDAPSSPNYLTGDQRSQLRTRLWALLTPRPCRKAAHFALAERAVETGDSDAALSRMESVCAIDPTFRGAYLSLRRFFP